MCEWPFPSSLRALCSERSYISSSRSSTCLSGSSFHTSGFQWTCWLKHPLSDLTLVWPLQPCSPGRWIARCLHHTLCFHGEMGKQGREGGREWLAVDIIKQDGKIQTRTHPLLSYLLPKPPHFYHTCICLLQIDISYQFSLFSSLVSGHDTRLEKETERERNTLGRNRKRKRYDVGHRANHTAP